MKTNIQRDPFARGGYVRQTLSKADTGSCQWCGQTKARMYEYAWERDDRAVSPGEFAGPFCTIDCYRTYYS